MDEEQITTLKDSQDRYTELLEYLKEIRKEMQAGYSKDEYRPNRATRRKMKGKK